MRLQFSSGRRQCGCQERAWTLQMLGRSWILQHQVAKPEIPAVEWWALVEYPWVSCDVAEFQLRQGWRKAQLDSVSLQQAYWWKLVLVRTSSPSPGLSQQTRYEHQVNTRGPLHAWPLYEPGQPPACPKQSLISREDCLAIRPSSVAIPTHSAFPLSKLNLSKCLLLKGLIQR